jgi:putative dimethyl sulfoxide reductase chaperone
METENQTTLSALRNFFLARTGKDLAAACATLANHKGTTPGPATFDSRYWEEAEFVYNRLFVGPMALQAPPYASYYLEPEPQLMGRSTLKVRRLYEMAGLVSSLQGFLPDDHLGVELDAALGLLTLAERFDAEEPRALWRYFLHEHLASWVPRFLDQARKAETGHPAVDLALDRLETWLKDQGTKEEGYDQ